MLESPLDFLGLAKKYLGKEKLEGFRFRANHTVVGSDRKIVVASVVSGSMWLHRCNGGKTVAVSEDKSHP